jgi:hypothetical protein
MKKVRTHILAMVAMATGIVACSKNDTSNNTIDLTNNGSYKVVVSGSEVYVQNLVGDTIQGYDTTGGPVGATGKRTFYSLERNEAVTDTANKTWDIAINAGKIWINGGVSGNKMGGGYNQKNAYSEVTMAVDSLFKADSAGSKRAIVGYDPSPATAASNGGWYTLNPPPGGASIFQMVPGRTILLKTASGKYAKLEMMCYYKGGTTPSVAMPKMERYYNFRYTYQADGSKTF